MAMEVMARYRLPEGDRDEAGRNAAAIRRRDPADRIEVTIRHADGTSEALPVAETMAGIIGDVFEKVSASDQVALLGDETELSPEDAATILGISRPLVRRRMDAGLLPFRWVGAHRRLRLADVLALKHREAPIRSALDALKDETDALIGNGL